MIKFENTEVIGWEAAIRGMRNPMNSWEKSDSPYGRYLGKKCSECGKYERSDADEYCDNCEVYIASTHLPDGFAIGPNDYKLMMKLRNAGTDHRKFMRMITVYVDITAPLYWWKEFSTYKVGTVANSCSTMHKIADKEFTLEDFSCEHLLGDEIDGWPYPGQSPYGLMWDIVDKLNELRKLYSKTGKSKKCWWQMIQLLPSSYNQRRTVEMNYEVLANIYKSRKNHKLDEWSVGFMKWIESLPYSELITGTDIKEE